MDLVIENGLIIDGTGNPGYTATVGIDGSRIVILRGDTTGVRARDRIDATGRVVAPGFIDMHSHSGLVLLDDPAHEAKLRQGVTTEVIGVDGISYAPIQDEHELWQLVRLNSGLDGRPNIDYNWRSVADYLNRFDRKVGVNIAFLVGNSTLRMCTVGWNDVPAASRDVANMQALLREAVSEGAFGISSGLDYPPGSYASTEELSNLCEVAATLGAIYHTHVRYQLGDRYLDPFREAIEIGRRSGVSVHLTHLYRRATMPGGSARLLDLVESARDDGQDVTFDAYPYEWSSTRLLILLPGWLQDGGPDVLLERLGDARLRPRIRADVDKRAANYGGEHVWDHIRLGYFALQENQRYEGKTVAEICNERGEHPADVMCELLRSEDLRINEVAAGPDPVSLPRFVAHPLGMVGTDSVFLGSRPSPRTYGSYPRILGEFVREERLMSLSEAVRKMTSYPAQRLGIQNRGILHDGMIADVVVFDPKSIKSLSTSEIPAQQPVGIFEVLVGGIPVIRDGRMTGALPGRALRYGRRDR